MSAGLASLLVLFLLLACLATGVPIFAAVLCAAAMALALLADFDAHRLGATMARVALRASSSWELSAIPLFIWMGEIVFRTSLVRRMFGGLSALTARLPGGLLHANVFGCALFAAVSGSSAATTATVGKITLGELRKRGYDDNLAVGSLAGAGTLGLLIPPSIVLIIYGLLAEVSIARLFAAGLAPGIMLALFYSAYIAARCRLRGGARSTTAATADEEKSVAALAALWKLTPMLVLIFIVLGGIYAGYATPSEAAATGVLAAMILAACFRELSWQLLRESLLAAVPVSCMICGLLFAAAFLSTAMGFLQIPQDAAAFVGELDLSPTGLIVALALFYLALGLILDGVSAMVMTLPIALPLVVAAGLDPLWFGVFLVVLVEAGQVTPPVGFNLFVIQGISGAPILRTAKSALPFFLLMCLGAATLAAFPQIALAPQRWIFG